MDREALSLISYAASSNLNLGPVPNRRASVRLMSSSIAAKARRTRGESGDLSVARTWSPSRRTAPGGIHAGTVDGRALCRMFNHAIRGLSRPKRLSSDHDPLYRFHQWCANLRVLQVTEVKSVPYVPLSHPFVERLIGTLRRECVDQLLFWSASDLEDKLVAFQDFYNAHRAHASLDGRTPVPIRKDVARLDRYRWDAHCRGLYQTPIAA